MRRKAAEPLELADLRELIDAGGAGSYAQTFIRNQYVYDDREDRHVITVNGSKFKWNRDHFRNRIVVATLCNFLKQSITSKGLKIRPRSLRASTSQSWSDGTYRPQEYPAGLSVTLSVQAGVQWIGAQYDWRSSNFNVRLNLNRPVQPGPWKVTGADGYVYVGNQYSRKHDLLREVAWGIMDAFNIPQPEAAQWLEKMEETDR